MTSAYDDFRNLIRDEQDKRIATYIKQGHSKEELCLLFAIPSSRITEAIAAVEEKQTKEVHATNGNKKADLSRPSGIPEQESKVATTGDIGGWLENEDLPQSLLDSKGEETLNFPHSSINKDVAHELAQFEGDSLIFDHLTSIDKEVAKELARFKENLYLDGLTSIDREVAKELARFKGYYLSLSGLHSIDEDTAQELEKFKGTLKVKVSKPVRVNLEHKYEGECIGHGTNPLFVKTPRKPRMLRNQCGILRPESEVLAERNKKQEPLSNDNKRTDFSFFRQTLNHKSENRSTLPAREQPAASNNSGASALPQLFIAIGVVIVLLALRMDTTVQVPGTTMRVHNLSLATQQRNYLILGGVVLFAGILTLQSSSGFNSQLVVAFGKKLAICLFALWLLGMVVQAFMLIFFGKPIDLFPS